MRGGELVVAERRKDTHTPTVMDGASGGQVSCLVIPHQQLHLYVDYR